MRKVWHHQIWIQNNIGFMVSDLIYTSLYRNYYQWNLGVFNFYELLLTYLDFLSPYFPKTWNLNLVFKMKLSSSIINYYHPKKNNLCVDLALWMTKKCFSEEDVKSFVKKKILDLDNKSCLVRAITKYMDVSHFFILQQSKLGD